MKILVIEDDHSSFEILRLQCSKLGILEENITHVSNLQKAKELISSNLKDFDVIFLDLRLPDAYEILSLEFIQSHPGHKIVIYSGTDDDKLIFDCMKSGAVHFLSKNGFSLKDLKRTLLYATAKE